MSFVLFFVFVFFVFFYVIVHVRRFFPQHGNDIVLGYTLSSVFIYQFLQVIPEVL